MKGFFAAIRFLTIIPVPGEIGTGEDDLAVSLVYFPFVGLLLGIIGGTIFYLVGPYIAQPVEIVLAVGLLVAFSGGLHMDGVADCGDGFFSSRPREQILEIMRDSRVGTMGVISIILTLSVKAAAMLSVVDGELWPILALMPIAGRCSLPIMMALLPYARKEGGLATVFYGQNALLEALWAVGLLFLFSWLIVGIVGFLIALGVLLFVLAFCFYCWKKIGGATGDTLGALCELSESVVALIYALIFSFIPAG